MSEERKRSNRISAQASHDRRKAQLLHLERQVTELQETNGQLRAELAEATVQLHKLTKPRTAEGHSTSPTQPASQPNSFTLQTSEAPGSCQKIIDEGHNSSRRSGDASVYYDDRLTRPEIMSAVKKPDSIAKAPRKAPRCAASNADVTRWSPHECITAHPEDTRQGFFKTKYELSIGAAQNGQFSKALAAGSENIFVLPKGPSGRVKLALEINEYPSRGGMPAIAGALAGWPVCRARLFAHVIVLSMPICVPRAPLGYLRPPSIYTPWPLLLWYW
ncbi:hypothetical protein B0H14DRAFT_3441575 [Mycena olivaceomarginata]|nr:hypothetical protein B0H14DRAFT_3441575 [Mycena olivaceomarginata]